jgi:transposase InsO family protein
MIAFIDDHRHEYRVEPICRILKIAPPTFYEHAARHPRPEATPPRIRRDDALKPEILQVFIENFQVYGAREVWRQLKREGFDIARCTVSTLMKAMRLKGVICGKRHRRTFSDKSAPGPLDRVNITLMRRRGTRSGSANSPMSPPGLATSPSTSSSTFRRGRTPLGVSLGQPGGLRSQCA